MVLLPMLLAALQVPAAPATAVPPVVTSEGGSVVVTAKRRPAPEAALAACLARRCLPDEDATASLALAEAKFVDGDYTRAARVVTDSLGRIRKFSRQYPEPVANLFRAQGRIAAHMGEYGDLKVAAINAHETLRDAFPAEDPRALAATIELGDMLYRIGQPQVAEGYYRQVVKRGDRAGQSGVAAIARLRLASLQAGPADRKPEPGAVRRAAATLGPLTEGRDPALARFRLPAALFLARLAERRGDGAAIDRVLRAIPAGARTAPILLSSDPIRLEQPGLSGGRDPLSYSNPDNLAPTYDVRRQWVDIGFWVQGDGRVSDPEVIRAGSARTGEWNRPVLAAIRSRRYAPLSGTAAGGVYRVERYTLTAGYQMLGNSRIRQREPTLRIEMLDLTAS